MSNQKKYIKNILEAVESQLESIITVKELLPFEGGDEDIKIQLEKIIQLAIKIKGDG
jgi:hypothetical protein